MSSSSAETVANIEDLLSQILLLMPLRSVVRFKIVSKRWLSLIISNHKLICRQRNISAFFSAKINQEDFMFISLNQEETSPSISCKAFKSLAQVQGVKDFTGFYHGFERKMRDVLHYLDIAKEQWLVAAATPPLPQLVNNFPSEILELAHKYFGESGGHLYMIETYHRYSTQIEVIEMARDYSEWVVKYYVDLNPVRAALLPPQEFSPLVVLNYFSREQEGDNQQREGSASLLLHMPGKVISYYLRDMTYQTIQTSVELTNKQLILDGVSFHPYMESIASI